MAGRYGAWRRLEGNSLRPDLLDMGKRLLGYLDQQRRLSGVTSQVIRRAGRDGSLVEARFDGDIPVLRVLERQRPPDKDRVDHTLRALIVGGATFGMTSWTFLLAVDLERVWRSGRVEPLFHVAGDVPINAWALPAGRARGSLPLGTGISRQPGRTNRLQRSSKVLHIPASLSIAFYSARLDSVALLNPLAAIAAEMGYPALHEHAAYDSAAVMPKRNRAYYVWHGNTDAGVTSAGYGLVAIDTLLQTVVTVGALKRYDGTSDYDLEAIDHGGLETWLLPSPDADLLFLAVKDTVAGIYRVYALSPDTLAEQYRIELLSVLGHTDIEDVAISNSGRTLVVIGYSSGDASRAVHLYDVATQAWTVTASYPTGGAQPVEVYNAMPPIFVRTEDGADFTLDALNAGDLAQESSVPITGTLNLRPRAEFLSVDTKRAYDVGFTDLDNPVPPAGLTVTDPRTGDLLRSEPVFDGLLLRPTPVDDPVAATITGANIFALVTI